MIKQKQNNMRRNRMDLMEPAEKSIQEAVWEVEKLGSDLRLTEAVNLLSKVKDLISDYIDEKQNPPVKEG